MSQPLVSVFVPTYNHVRYVREAVLSAAEQDYPNVQVVVGDDGSTDGTRDIVAGLAAQYPDRITAVLGDHVGLAGNCNRVLEACRGEYIAFSAGDDLFLPGKIARQVAWFEEDPRRAICGHDIDVFDSESGRILFRWSEYFPIPREGRGASRIVRVGHVFPGPSLMTRASVIGSSRFDSRLGLMCDWKFWIEAFAGDGLYGSVDGVLARYRRHPASVTWDDRTFDGRMTDVLMTLGIVEATRPAYLRECRSYRAKILLKLGGRRLTAGDRRGGRSYLLAALRSSTLVSWKVPAALLLACLPGTISQRVLSRYVTPTKI